VFTTVGLTGMIYCVDVITADTSSLRNRGLAFGYTSSPYIITAFAGPKAAEGFYQSNWRWGFGTFAIILPCVAAPMVLVLLYARGKAQKQGLLFKEPSNRTWYQSILHHAVEFDRKMNLLR
jgi:MFS family permease